MGSAKRFTTSSMISLLPVWHLRRSLLGAETPTKPCHWLWEIAISNSTDEQSQKPLRNNAMTELSNDIRSNLLRTLNLKGSYGMHSITRNKWLQVIMKRKRNVANAGFVDQDCKTLKHLTLLHISTLCSQPSSAFNFFGQHFHLCNSWLQHLFHHFSWFNQWEENQIGDGLVIWVSLSSCSILQTSCRYTNSSSRSSISLHLVEAKQISKNGVEVSKLIWQLSLYSYVRVKIEYREHLHASPNLISRYKPYLIV